MVTEPKEDSNKSEIFSFNEGEIARAIDIVYHLIEDSLLQDRTCQRLKREDFKVPLQIKNREGAVTSCVLTFAFDYYPNSHWMAFHLIISPSNNLKREIGKRLFSMDTKDSYLDPTKKMVHICLSSLKVSEDFRENGLGRALLRGTEKIKFSVFRKIESRFNLQVIRSIIRDDSDPIGWSSKAALDMGYKSIGIYDGFPSFEHFDEINAFRNLNSFQQRL